MLNIETSRRYLTYATPQFDGLVPSIQDLIRGFHEACEQHPAGSPERLALRIEFLDYLHSWVRDEYDRIEYGPGPQTSAYSDPCCD